MDERIKKVRKAFNLTQQEFADKLKIKRNTIAKYETGRGEPIDAVVSLICREFNVNEEWLRNGMGDMFVPESTDALDELIRKYNLPKSARILLGKFIQLNPEIQKGIADYIVAVAEALSKQDQESAVDFDIEAAVAAYRQQLVDEKKAEDKSSVSQSDTSNSKKMA